jgi:hypothetical protein
MENYVRRSNPVSDPNRPRCSDQLIRINNTDIIASHLALLAMTDTTQEYRKLRGHVYNILQIRYGYGIPKNNGRQKEKKSISCKGETE